MLKGIHPVISPEFLKLLAEMGHGDEIVLADAHFPGHSMNRTVLRADGVPITGLLEGLLPLFALDIYAPPLVMMAAVGSDTLDPAVEAEFLAIIHQHQPGVAVERIDRFAFYERTKGAHAVVMTGETRKYGNLLLKKGLTPPWPGG